MAQIQFKLESEIAHLYIVTSENGLQGILWKKQAAPMVQELKGTAPEMMHLKTTVRQLSEYFAGKRTQFDLVIDHGENSSIQGTDFQKKVWRELSKIPYGQTVSYKQVAQRVRTSAIRAVGTANGRNPISIVVPCHRVIASNGTLGGYAGGLETKKWLLALEQKHEPRSK